MSHNSEQIQAKAELLAKILEKHPPKQLAQLAFEQMQKKEPGSKDFKCLAALYELMNVLQ
jgi:hypothetical protein